MKKIYPILSLCLLLTVPALLNAQISLTTPNGSYSQDFDGMTATGTAYPSGWTGIRFAGSGTINATLSPLAITDGSANSGNVYNTGTTSATDRALGTLASGTTVPAFGASFTNNTGSTIANFSISGFSEQWRSGSSNAINEVIIFEYSTDATSLSTGTWTALTGLNLVEILTTTTAAAAVDGNNSANRTAITGSISSINLASGGTIWFRWRDADNTGSDGLYALDDLVVNYTNSGASTVSVASGTPAAEAAVPTAGTFTITFSSATAASTTLDYAYAGSSTFNTDYTVSYSAGTPSGSAATGTLTVPSGVTSVTVTITPIDDAAVEGTETVSLTISNPSGGYSLGNSSSSINITDDDFPKTASVTAGANANEPSTNGTFTVTLSDAAPVGGVTVTYTLAGTATSGADYTDGGAGSITIPAGLLSGVITLTTLNDASQENDETISITLTGANATYTIATANATINISDDGDLDPIPYTGTTYSQNFNTLATAATGNSFPTGWGISESGTNTNFSYAAGDGSSNSGNSYSFGNGTNADRALGGLRSGSLVPIFGGKFINNTGGTITSVTITYTGEQWRSGATGRVDKLDFQYSTDATTLANGTWTDVDALDFTSLSNTAVGALDGNAGANRSTKTFVLNGLSITAGTTFLLRWTDFDATGADDGMGIDDFIIAPGCTSPTNQPTGLSLTPALTSISGSFTAAAPGTDPADAYLVVMSTSSTLSASPASGTAYALDDAIGNGVVVAIGSSTSFTVNGLNPGTQYYFYVFSNISGTNCYNITAPLTGNTTTLTPPACTPPTVQASGLSVTNVTGTSMDLNYTRGNGDNILIVARTGSPVNSNPINSISYTAGSQIGTGNFVIYAGPASTFSYTGLTANTTYYFALYEYNSADFCYNTAALTGNFTTACVNPVNVSALQGVSGNAIVTVNWTLPSSSSCYDEIIVVASDATISGSGASFVAPANPVYAGPNQVVYRGTGTSVVVSGLTNGVNYFFKVFTRLGASYSSGVQVSAVPFDPASGYQYLFGNLHAHSSYSDGNKDNLTKIPSDDYAFARDALCMDFLGLSEHNHAGAGMSLSNYPLGYSQANAINGVAGGVSGNSIVALWGMEWGVISGGGHVLTYGFDDQLIGWEAGNYNIFCQKNDYTSLFGLINGQTGAFASLAHPNSGDFGNIAGTAYDATKDNAVVAVAVESGPAFSTSTTYNDYPSPLAYLSYYKTMLAKGYHLGASMDQDNHNMTFGTANGNRLVILAASKTRAEVMNAMRAMRFYASQDCNARVDYKLNSNVLGSTVTASGVPSITLSVTDIDGENAASIEIWGGPVGGSVPAAPLKTYAATNSIVFNSGTPENTQANLTSYYYFAIITQDDGNKIVTSPIWFNRSDVTLPVTLTDFKARYNAADNSVSIKWTTVQEINSRLFEVQRSTDGGLTFTTIGTVSAAGNSTSEINYQFIDYHPAKGKNFYRLRQVDIDNRFIYSRVALISIQDAGGTYFTVSPNPAASGFTYIYPATDVVSGKTTIVLNDMAGRQVKISTASFTGTAPLKYDLTGLKAGVYIIKIIAEDMVSTQKIVVQ